MKKTEKVAVSMPASTLRSLERARKRLGKSRSAVVTEAVNDWLRARQLGEADRRYVRGYLRHPETPEEVAASEVVAMDAMSSWEPWE